MHPEGRPRARVPLGLRLRTLFSFRDRRAPSTTNTPQAGHPQIPVEPTHVRQIGIEDYIRREMSRLGHTAALDRGLINELPRTHAELAAAMKGVDKLHHHMARNYSALQYGERYVGLNDWFLRERVGLDDRALKGNMLYPPQGIRSRRLEALRTDDPKYKEIGDLMAEVSADGHLLDVDKKGLLIDLEALRRGIDVRRGWELVRAVKSSSDGIEEFLTHPDTRASPTEVRDNIRKIKEARARFERVSGTLPKEGEFGMHHRAKLYPVFHEVYPGYRDMDKGE